MQQFRPLVNLPTFVDVNIYTNNKATNINFGNDTAIIYTPSAKTNQILLDESLSVENTYNRLFRTFWRDLIRDGTSKLKSRKYPSNQEFLVHVDPEYCAIYDYNCSFVIELLESSRENALQRVSNRKNAQETFLSACFFPAIPMGGIIGDFIGSLFGGEKLGSLIGACGLPFLIESFKWNFYRSYMLGCRWEEAQDFLKDVKIIDDDIYREIVESPQLEDTQDY